MPSLNYNTEHNSTAFLKRMPSDDRLHDSTIKAIGLGDLDLQPSDVERVGTAAQGQAGHPPVSVVAFARTPARGLAGLLRHHAVRVFAQHLAARWLHTKMKLPL